MERTSDQPMRYSAPDGAEEAALIRAAQAEPGAFGIIYQRYKDRVFAYLRTRLASNEDAADLTQQVFIRAFQALPRYRPGKTPFAAWLFRIAANAVTDESRRRRLTAVSLEFVPEQFWPRASEDDVPADDERLAALRKRVGLLAERERELLALRFAAGLTAREIGELLGRSEAAVQKQLSRTLTTLKEYYRENDLLA